MSLEKNINLGLSEAQLNKESSTFFTADSLFSLAASEVCVGGNVPPFLRNIIEAVLTELLNALGILKSYNLKNDLGPNAEKPLTYVSIEDRYMGQENHAECRINSTSNNFDKLAKDINTLICIFKDTCREVKKYGTYTTLENAINVINRMIVEEEQLLQNEKEKEKVIENLKTLYEKERLENIRTIEETNCKIQKLKFQGEDIHIYGQHEVIYFNEWEKARIEQNEMKCKAKEDNYLTTINDMTERIRLEERCHSEIVKYLEESKGDDMDEIQFWMKRYDEEIEQREGDIIHLKTDLDKITEDRVILEEKYKEREAAIKDYLEYKRIKNEKEQQRLKEENAAIKIQCWWRGVMVRKKLGPYGKKKKDKKGKDKKKEKKK